VKRITHAEGTAYLAFRLSTLFVALDLSQKESLMKKTRQREKKRLAKISSDERIKLHACS